MCKYDYDDEKYESKIFQLENEQSFARKNYIECIDILENYVCRDLVDLILSYHYYNDTIEHIKWRLCIYDYKVLLQFVRLKRNYDYCKKYLSNILDDSIVEQILMYHKYNICMKYERYCFHRKRCDQRFHNRMRRNRKHCDRRGCNRRFRDRIDRNRRFHNRNYVLGN